MKSKALGLINKNFESKTTLLKSSQIAKEYLDPEDNLN